MSNLMLPAHDDPCDNHDGAFDSGPLLPNGATHHAPRKIDIEIDDGILLTLRWVARVTVTRDAEYEECGQVNMCLSHHYADGKAVPFFQASYPDLELFTATLIGPVQERVQAAFAKAARGESKPKPKRTTKRRK